MITKLKLFNIGGVHEAEINLAEGLNVITGESGAGKSSVVSALELLSGRRGNAQVIKSGESQGEAEADFVTSLNFDDELDEDLRPINLKLNLKRVILNSRSYSSLQGVRVPLNIYSIAAGKLIHIQSQFAQLELLD
ncbi:MAG: AAA family ATPase, partial [Synergistaceae bacterium]|nr:AAA family ATPase [Synergistaceae bacterium]